MYTLFFFSTLIRIIIIVSILEHDRPCLQKVHRERREIRNVSKNGHPFRQSALQARCIRLFLYCVPEYVRNPADKVHDVSANLEEQRVAEEAQGEDSDRGAQDVSPRGHKEHHCRCHVRSVVHLLLLLARHVALQHKADEPDDAENVGRDVEAAAVQRFPGLHEQRMDEFSVYDICDEEHQQGDNGEAGLVDDVLGVVCARQTHGREDVLVAEVAQRQAHDKCCHEKDECEYDCSYDEERHVLEDKHLHIHHRRPSLLLSFFLFSLVFFDSSFSFIKWKIHIKLLKMNYELLLLLLNQVIVNIV